MTCMHDPHSQQRDAYYLHLQTISGSFVLHNTSTTLSQNEQRLRMMHKSMTFVTAAAATATATTAGLKDKEVTR